MQGDVKVIEYLNRALKNELMSINQYFLHSRLFQSWGLQKLAAHEYEESIDEMKHADRLIQRLLFLGGQPNMQDLDRLYIGKDVPQALQGDLTLEQAAHPLYKEAVGYAESCGDYGSRDLFAAILTSEEEHIDWLETQLTLIGQIGLENYLQAQM